MCSKRRVASGWKTSRFRQGGSMFTLHVNGQTQTFDGDPSMPMLWYLRDVLGLTGTKFGCGVAACGACTIHLDGEAVRSCVTPISDINGNICRCGTYQRIRAAIKQAAGA